VSAPGENWRSTGRRWLKFNLVGAFGIGVQLGTLALLTSGLRINYLWATALAVEAAVLHNFVWHERFTWADRACLTRRQVVRRLLRFNLTTGGVSILGNLLLMRLLVGQAHLPFLAANLLTIAGCSLINFVVNDRVVFRPLWPLPEKIALPAAPAAVPLRRAIPPFRRGDSSCKIDVL